MVKKKKTNGTKTVKSNASVQIFAANPTRKYAEFGGSQTQGLWIGIGQDAAVGTGPYVPAGAAYVIDSENLVDCAIYAILVTGADQVIGTLELS